MHSLLARTQARLTVASREGDVEITLIYSTLDYNLCAVLSPALWKLPDALTAIRELKAPSLRRAVARHGGSRSSRPHSTPFLLAYRLPCSSP